MAMVGAMIRWLFQIRAVITVLFIGMALALGTGSASANPTPGCHEMAAVYPSAASQTQATLGLGPCVEGNCCAANAADCCFSPVCGSGCGVGAIAVAEAPVVTMPRTVRSIWPLLPITGQPGLEPQADRHPPRPSK